MALKLKDDDCSDHERMSQVETQLQIIVLTVENLMDGLSIVGTRSELMNDTRQ